MTNDLTPIIESGTRVSVYLDAADGTMVLPGTITHLYDGTQDAVILLRRGQRKPTIIPASRVLYDEADEAR